MRILVSGSSGFIGSALVDRLRARHEVVRLVRRAPGSGEIAWRPERGELDAASVEGFDGVVHLAGVGIGDRRWTEAYKRAVLDSRIDGTTLLAGTLAKLERPPSVMVGASAIGYYGDRGDEILAEDSPPGTGFVAEVVKAWEASTRAAAEGGIRVVRIRSGLVFDPSGGILKRSLMPFRFGVGGRLGSGRQWWSWISLDDELRAIEHALTNDSVSGAANLVGPDPVTNREFTRIAASVMRRPALFPAPEAALRIALGAERAKDLLFVSQRVVPEVLAATGFTFQDPELEGALRRMLDR